MTPVRSARRGPETGGRRTTSDVVETLAQDQPVESANETERGNETIPTFIVVDDERGILDTYAAYLGSAPAPHAVRSARRTAAAPVSSDLSHYRLLLAETGDEAVALVEQQYAAGGIVHAGFFDMKMPGGMDGLETIRRLREIDRRILCVIVTAYQDRSLDDIAGAIGLGEMDTWDYLNKPFTANEIVQKARNLTATWHRRRREELHSQELELAVSERTAALAAANRDLEVKHRQIEAALAEIEEANRRLTGEMQERERVETELRLAQKLEAVGQLAAGIAHEINTPMQYIGDNLEYLRKAFIRLDPILAKLAALPKITDAVARTELIEEILSDIERSKAAMIQERIPRSIENALEGVSAVARIVRAMKDFSHPGSDEKTAVDLNHAIDSSITVSRNEWKYVAVAEFIPDASLPDIEGLPAEINQVLLNLIINAAHAVAARWESSGQLGRIGIATSYDDISVEIRVEDNGTGIPAHIIDQIFTPFFTTKEVGKGTGQGLALVHNVVVDRHGGQLLVESTVGEGTTFVVKLPRTSRAA